MGERGSQCTALILADTPPVDVTRADIAADLSDRVAMVAHDRPLEGLVARREYPQQASRRGKVNTTFLPTHTRRKSP